LWPTKADPNELELAVLNIAVNARDAMPDGGRLTIAARNAGEAEAGAAGLAGEFVAVSLADTGSGIPREVLARVFEPFFTTKPAGEGTGLGLSVSYGIVQTHGGEIVARSTPGAGATFEVLLPADHTPGAVTSDLPAPFPPRRS
jgi:signal transduction histidine kinase